MGLADLMTLADVQAMRAGKPIAKARPRMLDREDQRAKRETLDEQESAKTRIRAGGRCEVAVIAEGRCARRDVHTHHMLSGWGLRARGASALAQHKQRTCLRCHRLIEGNVLKLVQMGKQPVWTDRYTRAK